MLERTLAVVIPLMSGYSSTVPSPVCALAVNGIRQEMN